MAIVSLKDRNLLIHTDRPDRLGQLTQKRWSNHDKAFVTPATMKHLQVVAKAYPIGPDWTDDAAGFHQLMLDLESARERNAKLTRDREQIDITGLDDRMWGKYAPYKHQRQALALANTLPEFAYFMDQGTGKTLTAINDACEWWRRGEIELVIVVCPNSVKTNWRRPNIGDKAGDACELETHKPPDVPFVSHVWMSTSNRDNRAQKAAFERSLGGKANALHWLVINVEALTTSAVQGYLHELVERHKTMIVIDESTRIKNPSAQRTKVMLSLSKYAVVRRIMSGTPVIKAPEHAWAQLRFLGPDAMPFESVTAFKKRFVISSRPFGYSGPEKVEGYQHLEELSHLIDRVSFRVTKDQCLDLPPKVYSKRFLKMTKEQEHAYHEMRKRAYVFLEAAGVEVQATIILVQMLRLHQIACGFLPRIDPDSGKAVDVVPLMPAEENPKFMEALEIIRDGSGKSIVWTQFTPQLLQFSELLTAEKINHVLFYGGVDDEGRVEARRRFQNDDDCTVFLGNQSAGGIGLTLTAADQSIYLSNSFSTEGRVQSEDRCHRIGSERHHSVNYFDLLMENTIDEKIVSVLRNNRRLSDEIMKDGWREWI